MTKKFLATAAASALMALGFGLQNAAAAPQILALIATGDATTLQCSGEACSANFSAFCLQSDRRTPVRGTAYSFADSREIRLVGLRNDGEAIELDAATELQVASLRGQLAVRIVMPRERLEALGLTQVSVQIGEGVTLLPDAIEGDDNPLSESEIAVATGPLRRAGSHVVDWDGSHMGALRVVNQLTNQLQANSNSPSSTQDRLVAAALSSKTMAGLSEEGRQVAKGMLDICHVSTDAGAYDSLRQCLETKHDSYLWRLNVDYWLAVHRGS